ncbi:MAG: septum formation initiator family protein [Candidatus Marinimicrobia bacterium]|nr:septum formation initiator family protein [Candidatus Neomarinimicrobiota bacterium]
MVATEKGKKEKSIQSLFRVFKMLLGTTLFLLIFVLGDYGLYQIYVLDKNTKSVEKSIHDLQAEKDSLIINREKLKNDIAFIEKIAREKYRMAKKGEKVFRVIEK